jgi:hypothetical protein
LHQHHQQTQPSTHLLFQPLYHAKNIDLTLNQNNAKTKQEGFVFQKPPKSCDVTKCKLVHKTTREKYDDLFLVGHKPIARSKFLSAVFFWVLKRIVYHLMLKRHKDKIKVRIMWYNSIEYVCLVFVLSIDLDHLNEIAREVEVLGQYWELNFFPFRRPTYCHGYECIFMQKLN